MDKCYDQLIDEHYTNYDSIKPSEHSESPYNPRIASNSNNEGLAKKILTTDEICDEDNFDDETMNTRGASSSFSAN